jgi:hypothetical protein
VRYQTALRSENHDFSINRRPYTHRRGAGQASFLTRANDVLILAKIPIKSMDKAWIGIILMEKKELC